MPFDFEHEFAPAKVKDGFVSITIMSHTLPDGSTINLRSSRHREWTHDSVILSLDRDGQPVTSEGRNYTIRIFKAVVKAVRQYVIMRRPQHIMFMYKEVNGRQQEVCWRLVSRVMWGYKMRWLDDPWDDFYRLHGRVYDFLDQVNEPPGLRMHVIQRLHSK